jgi:hypothetical protein
MDKTFAQIEKFDMSVDNLSVRSFMPSLRTTH